MFYFKIIGKVYIIYTPSLNNKPAYNADIPLPSLTQTKHPAEHSTLQHELTQQGIQLRDLALGPVGRRLYTARSNLMEYGCHLGVITVWFLM